MKEQKKDQQLQATQELMDKIHRVGQEILDEFAKICDENGLTYYIIAGTLIGAVRHKGPIPWDDDVDVSMPRADAEKFKQLMLAQPEDAPYHIQCIETEPNYPPFTMRFTRRGTVYNLSCWTNMDLNCREMWVDILPLDDSPGGVSLSYQLLGKRIAVMKRLAINKVRKKNDSIKSKLAHLAVKPFSYRSIRAHTDKLMHKWNGKGCDHYVSWASKYDFNKQTMPKVWFDPPTEVIYNGKYYKAPRDWDKVLTHVYGDYMQLPPEEKRVWHVPDRIELPD